MAPRVLLLTTLGVVLFLPSAARAQAWVVPEREGSVSILYHHLFVEDHVFSLGERQDVGQIRSQMLSADLEFGVTDRLSIRAVLPYVASRYTGGSPHGYRGQAPAAFEKLDDGTYHATIQDLRVEARYGAREFPVAIAPFVAVNMPTHDYEFFAHSAPGLNLAEVQIGTYGGVQRGSLSLQGRLAYGIYERVVGFRRTRTNLDAEIGWLATRTVRVSAFQTVQVSHGGVELPWQEVLDKTIAAHDWWPHHDQIGRANTFNLGGGMSVQIAPAIAVHGSLLTTLAGRNTHAVKYGLMLGTSWAFGGPRRHHEPPAPRPPRS
jgi:hypothetical protein